MDKDILLQQYLDGELGPEEEREALHIFAEDPELRQMLHFEQRLQNIFRKDVSMASFSVPAGFTDRVMHSIEKEEQEEVVRLPDTLEKIRDRLRWLWQPRTVQLRPAYAALAILLITAVVSLPYIGQIPTENQTTMSIQSVQPVSETSDKVWLRFVFIDNSARTVEVAGDFSNWEPIPLTQQVINGEQVWTGLVSMDRGEHRYMFVKDGKEWVTDPLAPVQREDGFGNKNAVIYL